MNPTSTKKVGLEIYVSSRGDTERDIASSAEYSVQGDRSARSRTGYTGVNPTVMSSSSSSSSSSSTSSTPSSPSCPSWVKFLPPPLRDQSSSTSIYLLLRRSFTSSRGGNSIHHLLYRRYVHPSMVRNLQSHRQDRHSEAHRQAASASSPDILSGFSAIHPKEASCNAEEAS